MLSNGQTLHVQAIYKTNNEYTSLTLKLRTQFCLYVPLFQIIFSKYIIHVLHKILSMNSHHFPIVMNTGDFYNRDEVFSVCLELQLDNYIIRINSGLKTLNIISLFQAVPHLAHKLSTQELNLLGIHLRSMVIRSISLFIYTAYSWSFSSKIYVSVSV